MRERRVPLRPTGGAMRAFAARNCRHTLIVFPSYSHSFGTFDHAFPLIAGVCALMLPQGISLIASLLPEARDVRFLDENVRLLVSADHPA
jgi:hypothetical protein